MTKLLEQALETARHLTADRQDDIARMMLLYAEIPVIQLIAEEEADLASADEEVAQGDFATDEQMRDIWTKHGL
ncbi:MAG TPA: hypothetical protein VIJ06_08500 [Methylovirgula sp.]